MPQEMAIDYTSVVIAALVGVVAIGAMFAANYIIAPRRHSTAKDLPIECGIPPEPFTWSQIHVRYYIFAILFLIFDVEAVFLFPWALVFLSSVPAVFYEMLAFIGILAFGIVYGWKKGALQWR